jgi:RHS repeat-associated protein
VGILPASATAQQWNYDNSGNWQSTTKTIAGNTTTETRNHSVSDQITSIAGNAAIHDAKGNLTEYEINTKQYNVDYDLENRITKVDVNNSDVEYRYDALGRQIIRKEGSTETALLWWRNSECAEYEHGAGQATVQNDIMSHPIALNSVIARAVEGSKFYLEFYHKNYLDHVYAVSDDNGNLTEHCRYTAFGEVTIYNGTGTIQTSTQINNSILWNTRRLDQVSNYYLYKYRHYDPALSRWPSRDPIEERGGVNLYGFINNQPTHSWDYLGLDNYVLLYDTADPMFKNWVDAVKKKIENGDNTYFDDDVNYDPDEDTIQCIPMGEKTIETLLKIEDIRYFASFGHGSSGKIWWSYPDGKGGNSTIATGIPGFRLNDIDTPTFTLEALTKLKYTKVTTIEFYHCYTAKWLGCKKDGELDYPDDESTSPKDPDDCECKESIISHVKVKLDERNKKELEPFTYRLYGSPTGISNGYPGFRGWPRTNGSHKKTGTGGP